MKIKELTSIEVNFVMLRQSFLFGAVLFLLVPALKAQDQLNGQRLLDDIPFELSFEENLGQFKGGYRFKAIDKQAQYFFWEDGVSSIVRDAAGETSFHYRLKFENSNPAGCLYGGKKVVDKKRGRVNYFTGEKGLMSGIPTHGELFYEQLWSGIDAHFYESEEGMKYDFIVEPGGNPGNIALRTEGISDLNVSHEGELILTTPLGEIRKGKPYTWQIIDGMRVEVDCQYALADGIISFKPGSYDPAYELIIDPVALKYSTLLGEGSNDYHVTRSVYNNGKLYLTGVVTWHGGEPFGYPVDNQYGEAGTISTDSGYYKAFITCINADGSEVLWHTLFNYTTPWSVNGDDYVFSTYGKEIAVNPEGDVFFLLISKGLLTNINPLTTGPQATTVADPDRGDFSYFSLFRFNPDGDQIKYFTYVQPQEGSGGSAQIWAPERDIYDKEPNELYYDFPRSFNESLMQVKPNGNLVVGLNFQKGQFASKTPSSWLPSGGYYNGGDTSKGDLGVIYELDTDVPGEAGLLHAAYIHDMRLLKTLALDPKGNVYFTGQTWNYTPSIATSTIGNGLATKASIGSTGNSRGLFKFSSDLTTPLFGAISFADYPTKNYQVGRGQTIAVDDDENIYFSESVAIRLTAGDINTFDPNTSLGFSGDRVDFITPITPLDAAVTGDFEAFAYNVVMKLPASNYAQPEWQAIMNGQALYIDQGAGNMMLDDNNTLHISYLSSSADFYDQPPLATEGAIMDIATPGSPSWPSFSSTNNSPYNSYAQYVQLKTDGTLQYATPIGFAFGNPNFGIINLSMALDHEKSSAYILSTFFPTPGHSLPITPSYYDQDQKKQITVIGSDIESNRLKALLTVFHDVTPLNNVIDTFPAGEDEFCVGSLIGLGSGSNPLSGSLPGYISGDGSDSTHNLPLITFGGAPFEHPQPGLPKTTYQWQKSTDGGNTWAVIPNSNKKDLKPKPENTADTIQYRRLIFSLNDTAYSNTTTAYITGTSFTLGINGPIGPYYYCPGASNPVDIEIIGASGGNITWAWYKGFTPLTGVITPTSGSGDTSTFSATIDVTSTVDDAGFYRLVVEDGTGCKKEYFLTILPKTQSIYNYPDASFCPGDTGLILGPSVINPLFDYQITGPGGFSSNDPKTFLPSTATTGTYDLQVKLKTDGSYCAGGQTSVDVVGAVPHDAALQDLQDVGFCESAEPAPIGLSGSAPAGYNFYWTPSNINSGGISDQTAFSPTFSPRPRPFGYIPVDEINYLFQATRASDGCVFESSMTVRDTAVGVVNIPNDQEARFTCSPGSISFPNSAAVGTYFKWQVDSTNYPGGVDALYASSSFGMNGYGNSTANTSALTLFFPPGNYDLYLSVRGSYFPIGTTSCEAMDQVKISFFCSSSPGGSGGGFMCSEVAATTVGGAAGECADTLFLKGIINTWETTTWKVTSVNGAAPAAGKEQGGLFYEVGDSLVPLAAGSDHPVDVIVIMNDATYGFPGADSVVYTFEGTYYDANQMLQTCSDDITLYSPNLIPTFAFNLPQDFCSFPGPGRKVTTNGNNEIPYTISGTDFATPVPPGYQYNWSTVSGGRETTISDTTIIYPTLSPTTSEDYVFSVIDTATGCISRDTFNMNIYTVQVEAGSDMNDICPGTVVQFEGSAPSGYSYSWSPGVGLYFPVPDSANSMVANPFLLSPVTTATGTEFALTGTEPNSGCAALDSFTLISATTGPPAFATTTNYYGCPSKTLILGPSSTYPANQSLNYSWTAGAGGNLAWLSDTTALNPTVAVPSTFTGSATFNLTITSGPDTAQCGSPRTGTYTINDLDPGFSPASPQNMTSCGTPVALTQSTTSGFTNKWVPYTGLTTDSGGNTPYTGTNVSTVYADVSSPKTYYLVATHTLTGCKYLDPVLVNPPSGKEVDAGDDMVYCGTEPVTIGSVASGTTIEWTAVSYTTNPAGVPATAPDGTISSSTMLSWLNSTSIATPTFSQSTLTPGAYRYRVTVEPSGCNYSDDVVVRVYNFPSGLAGSNGTACPNVAFLLGEPTTAPGINYSWEVIAPAGADSLLPDPTVARPNVTLNSKTVFQLTYTQDASGCENTEFVSYDLAPGLDLPDTTLETSCTAINSYNLVSLISGYDTLMKPTWFRDLYPSAPVAVPASISGSNTLKFFLEAENSFGCTGVAEVTIPVEIPAQPAILNAYILSAKSEQINLADYTPANPSTPGGVFSWHTSDSASATNQLGNLLVTGVGSYYLFETSQSGCVSPSSIFSMSLLPARMGASFDRDTLFFLDTANVNFTITGPTLDSALNNIGFSWNLPAGMKFAGGSSSYGCGGMLTANAGATTVTYTGGLAFPDSTCTISIPIIADSGYYYLSADSVTFGAGLVSSITPDTVFVDTRGDTDGDGIDDYQELKDGNDRNDPCDPAQSPGYAAYDSTNTIWKTGDCDMDGIINGVEDSLGLDAYNTDTDGDGVADNSEIDSNSDPGDPCDPSQDPGYTGYVDTNTIWMAGDCDGDGLDNGSELDDSGDPYNADTDGDGVNDSTEVADMYDLTDPCNPSQDSTYTAFDSTNVIWQAADCDGDSLTNGQEINYGMNPYLYSPDSDGDGVPNGIEILNGWDEDDPCDPVQDPGYTGYVPGNGGWQAADCDGDGVTNGTEHTNMDDPYDPCDPQQMADYMAYDSSSVVWKAADCDGDSLSNGSELAQGANPYNSDSDGDGIDDGAEVNGSPASDPTDPCDPVRDSTFTAYDTTNTTWMAADCDGDGTSNGSEITAGTGLFNPCDPVQDTGYTGYDPDNVIWGAGDCDGDNILNGIEDSLSSDPYATESNFELFGNDSLIPPGNTGVRPEDLTDYGSRNLNSVKRHRFKIKNSVPGANGPLLTGPMITITGGDGMFTVEFDQDCEVLPSGQSYLIIKYQPTVEGCHTATISIPHNDPNKVNPYTFEIQGKTKNATCE